MPPGCHKYCQEVPGDSSGECARCCFKNDMLSCYPNSDLEMCCNVNGWIYKMTNDDFNEIVHSF